MTPLGYFKGLRESEGVSNGSRLDWGIGVDGAPKGVKC